VQCWQVLLSHSNVDADAEDANAGTRARNVLCDVDTRAEDRIADLGFPVLTMLAESPAVVNCVRYVLEASWKDILDEFVPVQPDSDEITTNLHVEALSAIAMWRGKCMAKLNKLQTCHGQSAYSFEYTQQAHQEGLAKHQKSCPFTLAPELTALASIMYGPCLLSFRDSLRLLDPHLCVAARATAGSDLGALFVLSRADIGLDASDGTKYTNVCEVVNPLSMLAMLERSDKGVVDLPALSEVFVRSLIAPHEVGVPNNLRHSGLMGTRLGVDFLFPSQQGRSGEQNSVDNRGSSQCFEAFPYWPQHWQAPFGEILHDTYEHVSAFGNYMALLTAEPGCSDPASCEDTLVLLPDHLRFENMSSNFFGTSGLCREHSFGMPLVPTNTHGVCTSNIRARTFSNTTVQTPGSESFSCESGNTETCSCSNTARVGIGGGMGDSVGHLWPLLRAFLEEDKLHTQVSRFSELKMGSMSMHDLAQFVDLEINIDLQETDSIDDIVRSQCYSSHDYGNDDRFVVAQKNCVHNSECVAQGKVCGAMGSCVEMLIDVENHLRSGSIEVGLNSPSCKTKQDKFSGASPWRRMHDILEQHGMCSHSNRVSYERMNDMLQALPSSKTGCTEHVDATHDLSYWVCDRGMVNWTWVRERPDFFSGTQNLDMRTKHVSYSILHDELFDIAPHLCDSDYMHSESLGWCGLQHVARNLTETRDEVENAHWMRTAPLHGQFSLLKPAETDVVERTQRINHAPRDKLRFMGMHRDMLKFDDDTSAEVRQNLAIQRCADLGVCQTEIFTAAGMHRNRMKPQQDLTAAPVEIAVTVKVNDMLECGPMGYLLEMPTSIHAVPSTRILCVLDRGVAPIAYWLQQIAHTLLTPQEESTACLDLFGKNWNSYGLQYNPVSLNFEYDGGRRDRNTALQFFLNSLLLMQNVPETMDSVLAAQKIHTCVSDIAGFIRRAPTFYTLPRREVGLYVLVDFGTYEIPLFWWLKYTLSLVVFRDASAVEVTVSRLNSQRPLRIDAFENRISPQDVMPSGGSLEGITLKQFWSRINAHELELFSESHDFVVQELARYIDATINVSAVMGCVSEFLVDPAKHTELRNVADNSNRAGTYAQTDTIEDMLDAVFTKYTPVPLWGGDMQRGVQMESELDDAALTCAKQFSDTNLMGYTDGLDSILSFNDTKFWQVKNAGFMESFLKKTFDVSIPVNTHSPIKNPNSMVQFYDDVVGGRRGIKILDLDFDAIHAELNNMNDIQDYAAEYLGTYDSMYEKYTAEDHRLAPPAQPVFSTGCSDSQAHNLCSTMPKTHCVYDKNRQSSLLKQGLSMGTWNTDAAIVSLFASNNPDSAFSEIDMCKKTSPSEFERFGHSHPNPDTSTSSRDPPGGGRCTMADLKAYGAGADFTRGPLSTRPDFRLMHPRMPDMKRCHLSEDTGPPELMMPPELDLTDGDHVRFVGEYYMPVPKNVAPARPTDRLCHRIDSQCVRGEDAELFGVSGKHAVDLKYDTIERNAYTQVNGRSAKFIPDLLREHTDMYTQDLDIDEVFATSTADLWTSKVVQRPDNNECKISKIVWPEGFKIVPYVLNSEKLGSDVSFSHVIYNDRILQRRSYDDGTEQQLYAHHFVGGESMREAGRQITSPTPLMSHCGMAVGHMHMFKRVSMETVGRTRMYERYHRFNQDIGQDVKFDATSDPVFGSGISESLRTFLGFGSNNIIDSAVARVALGNFMHTYDSKKRKWHLQGALSQQFFFNSRFRWTKHDTPSTIAPSRRSGRASAMTSAPPKSVETCIWLEGMKYCVYPTLQPQCRSPLSDADYQNRPTLPNPMPALFPHAKLPKGSEGWDPYTLATFYEQDAYEESTVRPWWSSTVCDMVSNFADRSTNYFFLELLFEKMPRFMYQMMGHYNDNGGIHNVCKNPNCLSLSSAYAKYDPVGLFIDLVDGNDCSACREIADRQFNSDTWRKRNRFLSDPKSVLKSLFEKNEYYQQFADDHSLANTDAFTQMLNLNMIVPEQSRGIGSFGPTTLSFASCQYGSKRTGLHELAPGYCDTMHTSTHRRITKPSLWSEIDGSPGQYLLPCRADANDNAELCHPILVPGGNTIITTADNTWTKKPEQSGACSYSVEFGGSFFCGPLAFLDKKLQDCGAGVTPQLHPVPVRGTEIDDNLMWKCATCNKYSDTRPILQNPENVRGAQSPVRQHRVGCGIYKRTVGSVDNEYSGPLTKRHRDYTKTMRDIRMALQTAFRNASEIESTLNAQLHLVFGDKLFIHDNAVWWDVAAKNTTQIDDAVTEPFREFGSGESIGHANEGCAVGNLRTNSDDCNFLTYDADVAYSNSILFRKDLDNGCMAEDNKQDHLKPDKCDVNITRSTVDRIKTFTDEIHLKKFGLELPMVQPGQTARTQIATHSFVSWIDGVLPFYAASARTNTHSKDTGDYLGYVLDSQARCRDSYRNKSLSEYACFMDAANKVQLVVPWLGKNYAFLKKENRLKIHEDPLVQGTEPPLQELFRVHMGTDMCYAVDGTTRLPCTATACLDDEYKTYENKTVFCESSKQSDRYYEDEIAKKLDRLYLERMHLENNLFNPNAEHSQCYLKYTPHDVELANGRQCRHMQAPMGYSPSIIRPFLRGVSSLNRSKVQIAADRMQKHEFYASPLPPRYSSLWAGQQMSATQAEGAVRLLHDFQAPPPRFSTACPDFLA